MAPSATGTQQISSKVKRPVPPGIQTNGVHSSTSSPSPSMSASRLPSGAKFTPNSAASNGIGNNNGARSATRRREAPPQLLGRGQRNSSVGLRSASLVGESNMTTSAEPQPYIKSEEYILKKYRDCPPSLVIHLHATHLRFDLQEGHFPYNSPMGKVMLEGLRQRVVPADLAEHFTEQQFYEGCMIVQIYDHKSTAPSQSPDRSSPTTGKAAPFSIHNYNALLTPSSYVPYQTQNAVSAKGKEAAGEDIKPKTTEQRDKENMPAPTLPNVSAPRKQPKVHTLVLHPTPLSNHIELAARAAEGKSLDSRRDSITLSVPPTPTTAVPPTPQTSMAPPAKRIKKTKVHLDSNTVYAAEAQIALATTAPLNLEPVSNSIGAAALLDSLAHPSHSEKPPAPKTRKRTVAEMAADEALAAEQERFMLLLDERLSSNAAAQGGANPTGGDGTAMGAAFEPRFERFKTIESIKATQEERKRLEKEKQLENERKLRQEQERNKLETEKRNEQEKLRQQQQQLQAQSQQRQASVSDSRQRQQMAEQAQARAQMQGVQNQIPHAHPQTTGMPPNGMPAQQRFHQQVSQAQNSSPIVRNGSPQSHSSPMPMVNNMNNIPMQQSNSSMGGSPPRPGSVVHQNHPQMAAPTSHGMTAQRSQQSHAGTPRLPVATPNNVQSTPLNRTISQTPRMSQNSPLQGQMPHNSQMQMLPNGQPMLNAQQAQFEQQRRMQMLRNQQQQAAAAQAQGMMQGQQINPQQSVAYQQMMRMQQQQQQQQLQQQQQQQQQQNMPNNLAMNYQQRVAAMLQAQGNGVPQNMNQNFMNNNPGIANIQMTQAQAAQFQHQQQQQAAIRMQAQQQAAVQQQMNQHQGQAQMNPQQLAMQFYMQQKQQFMATNPGGMMPEEMDKQFKLRAQQLASQQMQILAGRRRQQMMAAQQQQGMQNVMNGMQHQM